ncbi:hypothetical protein [Runella slithyformis]|uniref:Uncharacterized protein n=1 Tax=Runella slithyformis (strain ATCC 29530 / DSM 19594 / LMG 11500 / NCIMB 11436 / LSU 4) TaxID=761193 RepID=A0A7U3ZLT1_RUNSL|nr:hypothetical protein [Runella slithyformis]AEI49572.1 hypothetical protein Runsl_3193 [Runella slithyformis DSM 19594]
MKLTTEQLDLISKEIIAGGIKYQDLYEELLDHYILAIEDRMGQGQTFGEAFGEVHADFVNYKRPARTWDHYGVWETGEAEFGLRKLQDEYEDNLSEAISDRHWQIIKDYFRWPTLVSTLLVGLLTFQFAYLVPRPYFKWAIMICVFAPVFMALPQFIYALWLYISHRRRFFASLKGHAISLRITFILGAGQMAFRVPFSDNYSILKQGPLSLIAAITCFYIAYSLSFYQLYRERFKVTMV